MSICPGRDLSILRWRDDRGSAISPPRTRALFLSINRSCTRQKTWESHNRTSRSNSPVTVIPRVFSVQLDARGRAGDTGSRDAPRRDTRTAPGSALSSGRRVTSLFELLQELSLPKDHRQACRTVARLAPLIVRSAAMSC